MRSTYFERKLSAERGNYDHDIESELKEFALTKLKLNMAKAEIGNKHKRYGKLFSRATSNFEPFKLFRFAIAQRFNTQYVSIAWLKGYEMISRKNLFDSKRQQLVQFDNATFPGSFVLASYHYANTMLQLGDDYIWYGSSLLSDDVQTNSHECADSLGDNYQLFENYMDNFLMTSTKPTHNGDLTNPDAIDNMFKILGGDNICHLYTSDFGKNVKGKELQQESIHARGMVGQVICAMRSLKSGGNMLIKTFTFFNVFSMTLIMELSQHFEEFYICKPMTSKADNSECYLVGKRFKSEHAKEFIETLYYILRNESDYINGNVCKFTDYPKSAWLELIDIGKQLANRQIARIKFNIKTFNALLTKLNVRDISLIECESNSQAVKNILYQSKQLFKDQAKLDQEIYLSECPIKTLDSRDKLYLKPEDPPIWITSPPPPKHINRRKHNSGKYKRNY